jgi:hypothetical protein
MILDDGTLVNLENVAECIKQNGERHLTEHGGSPDDSYHIKFKQAIDYIVNCIETRQTIPMNLRTFALKVVYNRREKYTIKQMAKILNSIGTIKC